MIGVIFVKSSQLILMKIIIGSKFRAYIAFALGLLEVFFGYIFAKPEHIWMKPGIYVRRHGAHSHKKFAQTLSWI